MSFTEIAPAEMFTSCGPKISPCPDCGKSMARTGSQRWYRTDDNDFSKSVQICSACAHARGINEYKIPDPRQKSPGEKLLDMREKLLDMLEKLLDMLKPIPNPDYRSKFQEILAKYQGYQRLDLDKKLQRKSEVITGLEAIGFGGFPMFKFKSPV